MTSIQPDQSKKEFFDTQSNEYSDLVQYDNYLSYRKFSILDEYVQNGHNVLDVGCGDGGQMASIASKCKSIMGIDFSPAMVDAARKKMKRAHIDNATLQEASAEELPFDDNSFDVVYAFSTLMLVENIDKAIEEIIRTTKPDGVMVLDIMGKCNLANGYWQKFYKRRGMNGINTHHLHAFFAYLQSKGLVIKAVEGTGILDQWKYIPLIGRMTFLNKIFHNGSGKPDLDARLSNVRCLKPYANRWFFIATKAR